MLFQDDVGGLELQDPRTEGWIAATPTEGGVVLNTGDFMERLTNGYLKSAKHRVTPPPRRRDQPSGVNGELLPARYSIPYFVGPPTALIADPLPSCVTEASPARYKPMSFVEYATWRAQYSY